MSYIYHIINIKFLSVVYGFFRTLILNRPLSFVVQNFIVNPYSDIEKCPSDTRRIRNTGNTRPSLMKRLD